MPECCPQCDGKGTVSGLAHGRHGDRLLTNVRCDLCAGQGEIDDRTAAWLKIGTAHRLVRVARGDGNQHDWDFGKSPSECRRCGRKNTQSGK